MHVLYPSWLWKQTTHIEAALKGVFIFFGQHLSCHWDAFMSQIQPLKDADSGLGHSLCFHEFLKVTGRCVWLWMALNFVGQTSSKIQAVKDPSLVSFMAWETKDAFWGCIWRSLRIGTNLIVLLWSIQLSQSLCPQDCLKFTGRCVWLGKELNSAGQWSTKIWSSRSVFHDLICVSPSLQQWYKTQS